jgi:hypothetical protein
MSETIELIEVNDIEGNPKKHVIIRREDGSFLSYTKEYYDELQAQAEQSTPSLTDEAATK